jgi:hypothetical protein
MILLKDGVKYLPYEYGSEEELVQMVVEHIREIFGENAVYFAPQTMKTNVKIEARNDGIVLSIGQNLWYILEVELAVHPLDKHIIPQITKFNIAYQQPETKRKLAETLTSLVQQDPYLKATMEKQKIENIHKYIAETIETPPTIAIIIDQITPELEAICRNLPFKTKTTEFKTYTRENAGISVHIHQFKPVYEKPPVPKTLLNILTVMEQICKRGKTYDEAVKITAKKLKIYHGTVRAACTREIGLKSKQLRKLFDDKAKLKQVLIEKFPEYENIIKEAFP